MWTVSVKAGQIELKICMYVYIYSPDMDIIQKYSDNENNCEFG